jgi:hypothetical protein
MNELATEKYFHYTSLDALVGMLQSKTVWATHLSFLNDPSEGGLDRMSHATQLANRCLATGKNAAYDTQWFLSFFQELERWRAIHTYVFSMSKNKGSAAQWMTYGQNGKGVCIGFDFAISQFRVSEAPDSGEWSRLEFIGVGYRDPEAKISLDDLDSELAKYFNLEQPALEMCGHMGWADPFSPAQVVKLMKDSNYHQPDQEPKFMRKITSQLLSRKHIAYASEEECRLITNFAGTPSGVRVKGNQLIPYRKLYVNEKLPIAEVIVGPALEENQSLAVEYLLKNHGYNDVKVSKSNVPLRSQ